MIGEVSIGGVYILSVVLIFCIAVLLTFIVSRFLSIIGFYSITVYRPITDVAIFILLFAAIVWMSQSWRLGV